jgi:hypothetical protein
MIIASLNIRGLGGAVKWRFLKELVRTKLATISDSLGALKKLCYVLNVYSSCDPSGKRRLWEALLSAKNYFGMGAWCLAGDFNVVLQRDERKGVNTSLGNSARAEMIEFAGFVRDMEVIDLPVLCRKYTWFHANGLTMSRTNRVMVTDDWLVLWANPSLWVLPRTVSDHCPLVLKYNGVDWGPKPFWSNNHWLLQSEFKGLVEDFWRNCNFTGWMTFILKEKLKGLMMCIRGWHKRFTVWWIRRLIILLKQSEL